MSHAVATIIGSGRYKQVDTARRLALEAAIADLNFGKVPDAQTHAVLTAGNYRDLTAKDDSAKKRWMEGWKDRNYPDVRAKKKVGGAKQTSILQYAVLTGAHHGQTRGVAGGRYVGTTKWKSRGCPTQTNK